MASSRSRSLRQQIARQNAQIAQSGGVQVDDMSNPGSLPGGSGSPIAGTAANLGLTAGAGALTGMMTGAGAGAGATSALGGGLGSALVGLITAMCWGSAVYYPVESADWHACRLWIGAGWRTPVGESFRQWYRTHGEDFAAELEQDEELREAWRPFFAWACKKGHELNNSPIGDAA